MALDTRGAVVAAAAPDAPRRAVRAKTAAARQPVFLRKRVSSREMIYFTTQLSLMLDVGTSLTSATEALAEQTSNAWFKRVLLDLKQTMDEGMQFSDGLRRHPEVFDGIFISMVKAGEAGGYLREALDRIVQMREKRDNLLTEVRSALAYPTMLCIASAGVVIFVLVRILPKFMTFFEGKESLLPPTTRFLMALSQSLQAYWWAYILGLAAAGFGLTAFVRGSFGRRIIDELAVRLPLASRICNKIYTAQMLRTLGHLLESHVPLVDALEVTRQTMGNRLYRGLIDKIERSVQQGGRLSQAIADYPHITPAVRQMVATGEEVGNLYPVMLKLAEHYDKEIDQEMKTLSSMIEPAALIFLGGVVGVIVASVILPLFRLAHAIH